MAAERPEWLNTRFYAMAGVGLILLIAVIYFNFMSGPKVVKASPTDATFDTMARLESAFKSFVTREQRLPTGLEEVVQGKDQNDGWGRAVVFTPGEEGPKKTSFLIRSLGPDGQPETPDDWTTKVIFEDDGYGKLGPGPTEIKRGE